MPYSDVKPHETVVSSQSFFSKTYSSTRYGSDLVTPSHAIKLRVENGIKFISWIKDPMSIKVLTLLVGYIPPSPALKRH